MKRYRESKDIGCVIFSVRLNVGGRIFETLSTTLTKHKSLLREAVHDPDPFVKDKFDNLLVDVKPAVFEVILDWMRMGIFPETIGPGSTAAEGGNYMYENLLDTAKLLEIEDLLIELDYTRFVDHQFCILSVYDVYRVFVLDTEGYRRYISFDVWFSEDEKEMNIDYKNNVDVPVCKTLDPKVILKGREKEIISDFVREKYGK